jgi:hypothetical protein
MKNIRRTIRKESASPEKNAFGYLEQPSKYSRDKKGLFG